MNEPSSTPIYRAPPSKLAKYKEGEDACLFIKLFEQLWKGYVDPDLSNHFLAAIEPEAMTRFAADLNFDWNYPELKRLFLREFDDPVEVARLKEQFMRIKIDKSESLDEFAMRYYKLANKLALHDSCSLIDAKNALSQAIFPFHSLSSVCSAHIELARDFKQLHNIISLQAKNFRNLGNFHSNNQSLPKKRILVLDKETKEKHGPLFMKNTRCYRCNEFGNFG